MPNTSNSIFQKQPIMRRVCYAITPLLAYSIFLYGLRPLLQVAISFIAGILVEYIFEKQKQKKVSEAVLVTCYLYGLSLPPLLPIWMNIVGIAFSVFIGKCVFGGFGRNVYNPAMTGRLFIYLSFPSALTTLYWRQLSPIGRAFSETIGGGDYTAQAVDAITIATPLVSLRDGIIPPLTNLFLGLRSGSMGEGAIFLLVIAAIYMIANKTADFRLIVSTLIGAVLFLVFFYTIGAMPGFKENLNLREGLQVILAYLMSGSLLYVAVFMSTDPISGPNKPLSKWIYGFLIGAVTILIRLFSGFPEGVSFAVMIGNTFACLLDEVTPKAKKKVLKKTPKEIPQKTQDSSKVPAGKTSSAVATATALISQESAINVLDTSNNTNKNKGTS